MPDHPVSRRAPARTPEPELERENAESGELSFLQDQIKALLASPTLSGSRRAGRRRDVRPVLDAAILCAALAAVLK